MTHRRLQVDHAPTLADFNAKYFNDGWNLNQLLSAYSQAGFNCLATLDGQSLIGYITYTVTGDCADVDDLVVNPSYRKKGLGLALLNGCLLDLTQKGVGVVTLEVRSSNQPAVNLYTKAGFNKISLRKKYYSNGEDALVLQKELR